MTLICGAKVTNHPLKVEISLSCFACKALRASEERPDWDLLFRFYISELILDLDPHALIDIWALAQRFQKEFPGRLSNHFYVDLWKMSENLIYGEEEPPLQLGTQKKEVPDHLLN